MRCWFILDDGCEVLADYTDNAPELAGRLHIRVKREHLPEDIRATGDKGSQEFEYIHGYFGKTKRMRTNSRVSKTLVPTPSATPRTTEYMNLFHPCDGFGRV